MTQRPDYENDKVIKRFSEKMVPILNKWSDSQGEIENWERIIPSIIKDLTFDHDGYQLCKNLESHYYVFPDAELVGIMDEAIMILHEAVRESVKEWVKENNITCPFNIGQKLLYKVNSEWVSGNVTEIRENEARLVLSCPDLGHVNGSGYIVKYEDLKTEEEFQNLPNSEPLS